MPFAFHNALLVGVDPLTGDTADRPAMPIDEFQRLITFATPSHDWRLPMRFSEALERQPAGRPLEQCERANEVGTDEVLADHRMCREGAVLPSYAGRSEDRYCSCGAHVPLHRGGCRNSFGSAPQLVTRSYTLAAFRRG